MNKYKYLGITFPAIPLTWLPQIVLMYAKLDKYIRPWYIPRFVYNLIVSISEKYPNSDFWCTLSSKVSKKNHVGEIKIKFASLKVSGIFDPIAQGIVNDTIKSCDNICEQCGGSDNLNHIMINGWVKNLCPNCATNLKKNGGDIRNSTRN